MTRFARSQGSKASNEKLPEEATPWHVMKQQIVGNQQTVSQEKCSKSSLNNIDETKRNLKWATFNTPQDINNDRISTTKLTGSKNEGERNVNRKKSKRRIGKSLDNCGVSSSEINDHSFVISNNDGTGLVENGLVFPERKKSKKQKLFKLKEECSINVKSKNTDDYTGEHGDKIPVGNGELRNISEAKRIKKQKKEQKKRLVSVTNENYESEADINSVNERESKILNFNDVADIELKTENKIIKRGDSKLTKKNEKKLKRKHDTISNCDESRKKKKMEDDSNLNDSSIRSYNSDVQSVVVNNNKIKDKKKKKKKMEDDSNLNDSCIRSFNSDVQSVIVNNNKMKDKKKKKMEDDSNLNDSCIRSFNSDVQSVIVNNKKMKDKKKKKKMEDNSNLNDSSIRSYNSDVQSVVVNNKKMKNKKKKKDKEQSLNETKPEVATKNMKKRFTRYFDDHSLRGVQKEKDHKSSTFKPYERKNNRSFGEPKELIINGMKVDIVKYQGFEIELEEAKRIENFRKQLIEEKKLSYEEIAKIIKLERRKAEKALSRKKKKVCLKCRGYGHLLSQCPELEEGYINGQGTGICFKCGSTEHTHFECRVIRGDQYRFASCFMCGEEGHIARQCSLNSNGIYPKGGSCRICGNVNHLMKNCPQLEEQKESKSITVGTIESNKLESLEEDVNNEKMKTPSCPKRNIIKF